jgi:uncharacterized membrane protein YbhN (UPF0104 family)
MLIFGNMATELLFALAIGILARSLGYPIGFPELVQIHASVSLFAGLMPVPGGIGVFEAGMTFGLARAGMPEEVAFACALGFRIATFYLPPVWGAFAFRSLERGGHL